MDIAASSSLVSENTFTWVATLLALVIVWIILAVAIGREYSRRVASNKSNP